MDKHRQDTCIITPSDKSMVTAKYLTSTSESWLSVHLDNTMFGLRLTPKLVGGSSKSLKKSASQMEGGLSRQPSQMEGGLSRQPSQMEGGLKRLPSQMDPSNPKE